MPKVSNCKTTLKRKRDQFVYRYVFENNHKINIESK